MGIKMKNSEALMNEFKALMKELLDPKNDIGDPSDYDISLSAQEVRNRERFKIGIANHLLNRT